MWLLGAHPNPGPGDVERAVRQALVGLWTPPAIEEFQRPPRWDRATPAFERVSQQAQPVEVQRHRRLKPGFGYMPTN